MRTNVDCCRLTHALHAAEAEFGSDRSWWDLAQRAVSHGAPSSVINSFLIQWELMLNLGADAMIGPSVCADCLARLVAGRCPAREPALSGARDTVRP